VPTKIYTNDIRIMFLSSFILFEKYNIISEYFLVLINLQTYTTLYQTELIFFLLLDTHTFLHISIIWKQLQKYLVESQI
jgi:hypothetical protein